jgi:hypothetical protein
MATTPAPAPAPAPAVEPQASISSFGRIAGALFSPKPTFADIVRKPSWVAPLLVLLLTGLLLNLTLVNRVNWPEAFKEQISKSKFASSRFDNLDDAAKEKAYAQGVTQAKVGRYMRGVIGWPLLLLTRRRNLFWNLPADRRSSCDICALLCDCCIRTSAAGTERNTGRRCGHAERSERYRSGKLLGIQSRRSHAVRYAALASGSARLFRRVWIMGAPPGGSRVCGCRSKEAAVWKVHRACCWCECLLDAFLYHDCLDLLLKTAAKDLLIHWSGEFFV